MYFNYKEISSNEVDFLKINGRTLYNDGLFISWCNSGVELNFVGNRIEFNFDKYISEEPVYVPPLIVILPPFTVRLPALSMV